MQNTWTRRNIDLNLLLNNVKDFLKDKGFEVIIEDVEGGYKILAQNSPHYEFSGYISITIIGTPNEFSIELNFCGVSNKNIYMSKLLTFFGGGYLFLRDLRSRENRIKFEKDFWVHIHNTIESLSNTCDATRTFEERVI
jgi:hypothetical protein